VISPVLKTIVEIGPGTGVFTEHTLKYCRPPRYQIYEIDRDWSEWLAKTYPVEDCHADGKSLARTKSHSVDSIHAYGVFVYLPLMISIRYFREIARVAAPGAFVVFNIISERCLDERTTDAWLNSGLNYPCFLSTAYVSRLFEDNGFRLVDSFLWPLWVKTGCSEYLIFQKLET
jgi:16S rRNA A1518/A1519 N6-dimethyltransferase RsmA/KsgA/DIM1 with predicted DNA glycosylase/AP lyase activity